MIPQVARKLIIRYSKDSELVWDPFCGSGTAMVESMLLHRLSVGTDLNPFAIFLSKVKTNPIDSAILRNASRKVRGSQWSVDIPMWHPKKLKVYSVEANALG